jgi:hypothetical protein
MMFKSYDTFEEMMADMSRAETAAIRNTQPWQRNITWGKYWMRYVAEWDLIIFGYVNTEDENDKGCLEAGGDAEECKYEHDSMQDSYHRGYRFGTAYSVITPDGELGSTHISVMVPITKSQFENARDLKWDKDDIVQMAWFRETMEAIRKPGISAVNYDR